MDKDLLKELDQNKEKMVSALKNGKDIMIKLSPKGLKIQTVKVNKIN